MLEATLALGVVGILFGALLAFAAKRFEVPVDPRTKEIEEVLPGANCGACGYPGCSGLASAITKGEAPIDACTVGGSKVANIIGRIMGSAEVAEDKEPGLARVRCQGGRTQSQNRFLYEGIEDCKAAHFIMGGFKACTFGCLGLGTCVKVCPFGAMTMTSDGIPMVDRAKCTGCGKCVAACPRGLIEIVDRSCLVHVLCFSKDKGAVVRKVCKVGCIACKACERACKDDAIHVEENLARIDYSKCTNCGACAAKCPTKCIIDEGSAFRSQQAAS